MSWEELGKTQVKIDPSQNDVQLSGSKVTVDTEIIKPIPFVKQPASKLFFNKLSDESVSFKPAAYNYHDGYDYAFDGKYIVSSSDEWKTKNQGVLFSTLDLGSTPVSMVAWEDGTICLAGNDGNGNGKILLLDDINDSTPTILLECAAFNNFSVEFYSDGIQRIILAGEYTAGTEANDLYLSTNGGQNFNVIKSTTTLSTGNNHWHGVHYDPYGGIIWAGQGDAKNANIFYSQDLGQTWQEVQNAVGIHQPTLIFSFPDRVIFGEDSPVLTPGLFEWKRNEDINNVVLTRSLEFRPEMKAYNYYPDKNSLVQLDENTAYIVFHNQDDFYYIYATGDGGRSWHKLFTKKSTFEYRSVYFGRTQNNMLLSGGIIGGAYIIKGIEWI